MHTNCKAFGDLHLTQDLYGLHTWKNTIQNERFYILKYLMEGSKTPLLKRLLYTSMIRLVWLYGAALRNSKQYAQNGHVRNNTIHTDWKMPLVLRIKKKKYEIHHRKMLLHVNPLLNACMSNYHQTSIYVS